MEPKAKRLSDEEMGALAAHYVQALEPPSGGEPNRQDAVTIAQRLAQAFVADASEAPVDRRLEAARQAAQLLEAGGGPGSITAVLRPAFAPEPRPQPRAIGAFWSMPEPEPVLWRDSESGDDDEGAPAHSVLAAGETAVLAGAGGCGKSVIALALAAAAASAERRGFSTACGLRVRGGGAVVLSYEDSPVRIAHRLKRAGWQEDLALRVVEPTLPLFPLGANPDRPREHARAPFWEPVWTEIREAHPSLVLLDTGPKAMGGVADYTPGPVISFYQALEREAQAGGFGVLLVAHDTKAARSGGDPGAGAIAGSHQWHDCARGALHLARDRDDASALLLECVKANHGPRGWGARLCAIEDGRGIFAGFQAERLLDPKAMLEAREGSSGVGNGSAGRARTTAVSADGRKTTKSLPRRTVDGRDMAPWVD